jgi:hypothetical protein
MEEGEDERDSADELPPTNEFEGPLNPQIPPQSKDVGHKNVSAMDEDYNLVVVYERDSITGREIRNKVRMVEKIIDRVVTITPPKPLTISRHTQSDHPLKLDAYS